MDTLEVRYRINIEQITWSQDEKNFFEFAFHLSDLVLIVSFTNNLIALSETICRIRHVSFPYSAYTTRSSEKLIPSA